jgi:hypothetical protein
MENLSTLEIIGIIILVLLFGGVIWRIAKRLFAVAFVAVLVLLGIYFTKPEILYDWFGKDNVEKVETKVKDGSEELKEKSRESADKAIEALDSK